jgi:ABC-type branched-subunit amino acid transport system permease subunit
MGNGGNVCSCDHDHSNPTTGSLIRQQETRGSMRFLLSITFNVCIYTLLGMSLNLPLGYSGMLLLCGASLFGIGAYTYAIASHYSSSFIAISIMAMCLGAVVAFLI